MPGDENAVWWQGDREISPEDIAYIRRFTQQFAGLSRKELTCTLCEHLDWLTPAGQPKFTACAKLLARLEAAGELCLPVLHKHKSFPGRRPATPRRPSARTDPAAPLVRSLSELEPVQLHLVNDAHEQSLWSDSGSPAPYYHLPRRWQQPIAWRPVSLVFS